MAHKWLKWLVKKKYQTIKTIRAYEVYKITDRIRAIEKETDGLLSEIIGDRK